MGARNKRGLAVVDEPVAVLASVEFALDIVHPVGLKRIGHLIPLEDALDAREGPRELLTHPLVVLGIEGLRLRGEGDAQAVDIYDIAYLSRLGDDDHIVFLVVAVEPRLSAVLIRHHPLRNVRGQYRK